MHACVRACVIADCAIFCGLSRVTARALPRAYSTGNMGFFMEIGTEVCHVDNNVMFRYEYREIEFSHDQSISLRKVFKPMRSPSLKTLLRSL